MELSDLKKVQRIKLLCIRIIHTIVELEEPLDNQQISRADYLGRIHEQLAQLLDEFPNGL